MKKGIKKIWKNTFRHIFHGHNEEIETFKDNVLGTDVVYFHSSILEKHNLLGDGRAYHLS